MSEYGNDTYMMLTRGSQSGLYAVGFGIRAVVQLAQFLMRLHKEGILSGGEVEKYEKFVKATKGDFDIYNLPLANEPSREEQLSEIRSRLDVMGIRYHILPDVSENENSMQICIYKEDLQKFSQFHDAYIRDALSGGEKQVDDLRNFTGGRTSIISLPDASISDMKNAMETLRVDYAVLPDLNLKDGETQYVISNASLTSMKEAYRLYREGMLQRGVSLSDIKVISTKQYQDTGKLTPDEYMENASEKCKEAAAKYDGAEISEKEEDLFGDENEIRSSKCSACMDFHNDPDYEKLSVDDATLVHNDRDGLPEKLEEQFPDKFFCRIPGTFGDHEQILELPKSQVFKVESADRARYVAFVNKYDTPRVLTADGKPKEIYATGESLVENFGKEKEKVYPEGKKPKKQAKDSFHNFDEREYDWDAIERQLLSRGRTGSTPNVPDVPKAGMVK